MEKERIQKRLEEIEYEVSNLKEASDGLIATWQEEKEYIKRVRHLKSSIETAKLDAEKAEREGNLSKVAEIRYGKLIELQKELETVKKELDRKKDHRFLLKEEVTPDDVAEVVSSMTKIPVTKITQTEKTKLLSIEEELHKQVIGQDEAITLVSNAVKRARAGLSDAGKPIGTFIFFGTTGVGKTELAKALATYLFDGEEALVRFDMSEFMEPHSVSKLIGAPPGYVGYEEGGQLTEIIRRKPFSVVLLDEIEKAHQDVFNILLQVMDSGRLTDSKGRTVSFKNVILIMTSNLGSSIIQERFSAIGDSDKASIIAQVKNEVFMLMRREIKPEFLNRIDEIILFLPLDREEIKRIVDIQCKLLIEKISKQHMSIAISENARDWLAQLGYDPNFGARPLKRVFQRRITNLLSESLLQEEIKEGDSVTIDVENEDFVIIKNG